MENPHPTGTELRKSEIIGHLKAPSTPDKTLPQIPIEAPYTAEGQRKRLDYLASLRNASLDHLAGKKTFEHHADLQGNIENFVGMTQVPTGVIGPVAIHGSAAQGDYFIPLATSEGALVASYGRGGKATRLAGGITSICLSEGVQRSPVFRFEQIRDIGPFISWVLEHLEKFRAITAQNSRFARLEDLRTNIEGNHVILIFEFTTGDAAGQNMVTLCTEAICRYLLEHCPTKPVQWYIESNYSGDKKATALAFTHVRGKKVSAEVTLPRSVVKETLKTTPERMADYWQASTLAVIQSGAIGAQGHVANGLAALFLACGQDVACISEASIGVPRMELTSGGDLYASVTLPGLIVGTVGGGTSLPTQRECLELLGCAGQGGARVFAEVCGAVALAGEISIAAALSAGHFAQAHRQLGRK
ncbi:MAG: hydroxymethylglutaryl-CoA reductase [Salibacteraceae bacterium]